MATTERVPRRAPKASATPPCSSVLGDIVEELGGLRVERADQLRVGQAVDAIVRARKPTVSTETRAAS